MKDPLLLIALGVGALWLVQSDAFSPPAPDYWINQNGDINTMVYIPGSSPPWAGMRAATEAEVHRLLTPSTVNI